jgi:hypothetical protein
MRTSGGSGVGARRQPAHQRQPRDVRAQPVRDIPRGALAERDSPVHGVVAPRRGELRRPVPLPVSRPSLATRYPTRRREPLEVRLREASKPVTSDETNVKKQIQKSNSGHRETNNDRQGFRSVQIGQTESSRSHCPIVKRLVEVEESEIHWRAARDGKRSDCVVDIRGDDGVARKKTAARRFVPCGGRTADSRDRAPLTPSCSRWIHAV